MDRASLIRNKFEKGPVNEGYKSLSEESWRDWQWQLNQVTSSKNKMLYTPYYSGLFKGLQDGEKALERIRDKALSKDNDINGDFFFSKGDKDSAKECFETYVASQLPFRINDNFVNTLKEQGIRQINLNFLHPVECTLEAYEACSLLSDAGFILNNRMILVSRLNDNPKLVTELNHKLLMMRVRPYSIVNDGDVPREKGIEILEALRGWTSGLAVPYYLIKEASGRYQPALPSYIKSHENDQYVFRNYKNNEYFYKNSD